jgi:sucrose-6F-phosphate phosphohydrolase
MSTRLLLCTDLDRTLLPNGPQPESPGARMLFARLAARPEVKLVYVTGRHRKLVEKAISLYRLPFPDFVITDVGTKLWHVDGGIWRAQDDWETEIAADWGDLTRKDLVALFRDIRNLRLQETTKQNTHKVSYYVPLHAHRDVLLGQMRQRLEEKGVRASLIWSVDEPAGIGLLDVLPAGATKLHAIEFLARRLDFEQREIVYAGDSGNDLPVLASGIPSVLVGNAAADVRSVAEEAARAAGWADRLYVAHGGLLNMNGHYSAGILEGVVHYRPDALAWLEQETSGHD